MFKDSEIQRNDNRLASLRERLYVALDNEEQIIEGKIEENIRQQKLKMTKVGRLIPWLLGSQGNLIFMN